MKASRAAFAGVFVVAVLFAAALGDVPQWLPLDATEGSTGEPILQAPAVAFDVANAAIRRYGGLPRDAQLRGVAAETSASASFASGAPIVTAYSFTWQPRDAVAWGDHVIVTVGTTLDQHCAGPGTLPVRYGPAFTASTCRSYDVGYELRATWVRRVWQPWPVRAVTAALQRWRAPLASEPFSLTTRCAHVDVLALRRVVGSIGDPIVPLGFPRHQTTWDELTHAWHDPHDVIAHWSSPYPSVVLFGARAPVPFSDVVAGGNGGLAVRFAHPSRSRNAYVPEWLSFDSAIHDPVCPPRHLPDVAVLTRPSPAWETVVEVLRARAEREATQRTAQVVAVTSRVVAVDRRDRRHATVTVETKAPADGTWLAAYVFDEASSAILAVHYERTSK